MTHSELHLAVRLALKGTPYRSFVIVAESVEVEDGGVLVEWRVMVLAADENHPYFYIRNRNPTVALAEVHKRIEGVHRTEPAPPPELEGIGEPLAMTPAIGEEFK